MPRSGLCDQRRKNGTLLLKCSECSFVCLTSAKHLVNDLSISISTDVGTGLELLISTAQLL